MAKSIGSRTAKGGFENEQDVVDQLNAWVPHTSDRKAASTGSEVDRWLVAMGHVPSSVRKIIATNPPGTDKRDIEVKTFTGKRSLRKHLVSIKLLSSSRSSGTNQVQRKKVDIFVSQWSVPDDVAELLRLYTGKLAPSAARQPKPSDPRRVKANEFTSEEQQKVINWLTMHKDEIIDALFRGTQPIYAPNFLLVVNKKAPISTSAMTPMTRAISLFGSGEVKVADTTFRIGKIIMQRKGGDSGGEGAKDLQFKCNWNLLL